MNESLSLGHKIKLYRQRVNKSQFQLEVSIGAANGSISRIENDIVKPTKETLSKIANALKLKPSEIADLLDLKIFSPEELINAISLISKSLDLDTTLQTAVDIMFNLYPNYNGSVILLVDENDPDKIWAKTVSKMPFVTEALKLLPKKLADYYVSISKDPDSLVSRSVVEKKCFESLDLVDFSSNTIPSGPVRAVARFLNFQSGISIPMVFENKVIGCVLYTKRVKESYTEDEQRILQLLSNQIAVAIQNAKLFSEINRDLNSLKDKIQRLIYK